MSAPTKTAAKAAPRRKVARKAPAKDGVVNVVNGVNGNGNGASHEEPYVPTTEIRPPVEHKAEPKVEPKASHPVYGDKPLYVYHPKDGSPAIEFPHISTCTPTPLFFYDTRNMDEMHQAFEWMDLSGIPDSIGRRVFLLSPEEQGTVLREWFGGLNLSPAPGVSPPGES